MASHESENPDQDSQADVMRDRTLRSAAVLLCAASAGALQVAHAPPRCALTLQATATSPLVQSLDRVAAAAGDVIVVKYGGHAMTDPVAAEAFAADVALLQRLGLRPVVVHGGGPQIAAMLKKLEIESRFVSGLRVTDDNTMAVAEMVLCGSINKKIASAICESGGRAVGLSGRDDALVTATRKRGREVDPKTGEAREVDIGRVGEPQAVRAELLEALLEAGVTPVIAPVAYGEGGDAYNVNADTMAGAVAVALRARSLLLLTDVAGVMDSSKTVLDRITCERAQGLIDSGDAIGGMIPKLGTAMDAVRGGVGGAVVMDGRVTHCVIEHLFGDDMTGTLITDGE